MSQVIVDHETRVEILQIRPKGLTLFDALYNSLVLRNTLPYLPVSGLLNLAATCRDLRYLILQTPGVFRHVDLTRVKTAHFGTTNTEAERSLSVWRNVQLSEYLTEDDFYAGPLRGIFSTLKQRDILRDVQSLILDGLSVTAELCHEIINDPTYSVRMLSIRDVKNLNHGKLRAALAYACRSTRPEGAPRLKALYIFGSKEPATPLLHDADTTKMSVGAGWNHKSHKALGESLEGEADAWWSRKGRMLSNGIDADWAQCLVACQGLISFDAVLCQGPRHRNSPAFGKMHLRYACNPAIATFAVGGCASCGKAPEGLMNTETTHPSALPLLSPPPILSSSVQAATAPRPGGQAFAARCADCLRDRFCVTCNKWWCETCYEPFGHSHGVGVHEPSVTIVEYDGSWNSLDQVEPAPATMTKAKARVSRSCWECGMNCDDCIERTQKICRKCCGGYCLTHNEGSSSSFCDWCFSRGRGLTRV
ncbi:hypothetical protein LCI18_007285 [Fusarium solani-melongenae]|uniref:Uncharacterized protein n=1 Tax=Fusarium solani subsp. cucurbitae TaxID=2747967 RepID=A0ACD3Z562_FUSSC|nr:hypothetical protein LCI18_007285 [Fusarium solani-melongenae]